MRAIHNLYFGYQSKVSVFIKRFSPKLPRRHRKQKPSAFFHMLLSRPFILKRISTSRQRFVMKINATFPDSVLQQWLSMSTSKFEVFWPPITSTTSCTMEARLSLFSFIGYRRTICNPSLFVSSFCEVDYLCISKLIHF